MDTRRIIPALIAGAIGVVVLGLVVGGLGWLFDVQLPTGSVGIGAIGGILVYFRSTGGSDPNGGANETPNDDPTSS